MKKAIMQTLAVLLLSGPVLTASDLDSEVSRPKPTTSDRKLKPAKSQVGTASWYGKRFHGRQTANGETYDMFQFTAAHRTLPLGTMLKVTNLRNGRWIVVRVNDRGPYVGRRILDLSYGAAQMLAFRDKGIEKIKLEVIDQDNLAMATVSAD